MAWITDSLRGAIEACGRLNPFQRQSASTGIAGVFTHQLALAAYMSSGLMRRVIAIPAADRTQKWRDWQADKDDITLIEAEEKRLALAAKTREAEVLRGTGGGAFVIVTAGDHATPLTPEMVSEGGIVAINVVSRWEITPCEFDKFLSSPNYKMPTYFEVDSGTGAKQRIDRSRVICFRGDRVPVGTAIDEVEAFWGDSRLLQIFQAVQNSDHTQEWFVELVKKAKLLRIGIPDLDSYPAEQLNKRIALIAQGENSLNATVYRSGAGAEDPGEKIDDYQITWAGIPAFMDAIDQRLAAVSGIPFTKIMGRSPAGMNATGEHDMNNWWDVVGDGQENEVRPCLAALDPFLLRSAGVSKPDEIWWIWAPLRKPTEKEEAETFGLLMDAIVKMVDAGMAPREAVAEAVQNLIEERGYMPGLADALKKIPEDERYGLNPEDDGTDPSAIQAREEVDPNLAGSGGGRGSAPLARRAANDMATIVDRIGGHLGLEGDALAMLHKAMGVQEGE